MITRQKGIAMTKFLVDTCIWSEVLRRKAPDPTVREHLARMLRGLQAVLIGPVRQEILSGISDDDKFLKLRDRLSFLTDIPLYKNDYELAARYSNMCRHKGIQGSATDFLICAVAVRNNFVIFTSDKDFGQYKKIVTIQNPL